MSVVRAAGSVALPPDRARALWVDVRRWASFVEGFAHPLELSADWPARGARVVWRSTPGGRGRVSERVLDDGPASFATEVFEAALHGRQRALFAPAPEGPGSWVELELSYALSRAGPLAALTDVLFTRRAQRAALLRMLRRFAIEADEEAGLM